MTTAPAFSADDLISTIRRCALHARGDADASAALLEALATGLGIAVATMAQGQGPAIDTLLEGANAHAHETAVALAPIAALLAKEARP